MNNLSMPTVLKSKRFVTMLFEALFILVVALVPDLEQYAAQLIEASVVVAGLLIGGYSLEDAAVAFRTGVEKEKYK
ncbi:MAG: hypothetical protein ACYTBJ_26720 [Planctomycetota bacterium]